MAISTDWIDIKGYEGIYQVLYTGRIRRVLTNGYREVNPFLKHGKCGDRYIVNLYSNGKAKAVLMTKIMSENFIGARPDGYVPYHINGVQSDNYYTNIAYISKSELGRITASKAGAKTVARIDKDGELLDIYLSARDCARKNNTSRQTVSDYCNGNRKSPFSDDYCFIWEEDIVSTRKAMRRLNDKLVRKNKRDRNVYVFDKSGNQIKQFNSIAETARNMHYSYGFVRDCCHGRRNCSDYNFSFEKKMESDENYDVC